MNDASNFQPQDFACTCMRSLSCDHTNNSKCTKSYKVHTLYTPAAMLPIPCKLFRCQLHSACTPGGLAEHSTTGTCLVQLHHTQQNQIKRGNIMVPRSGDGMLAWWCRVVACTLQQVCTIQGSCVYFYHDLALVHLWHRHFIIFEVFCTTSFCLRDALHCAVRCHAGNVLHAEHTKVGPALAEDICGTLLHQAMKNQRRSAHANLLVGDSSPFG